MNRHQIDARVLLDTLRLSAAPDPETLAKRWEQADAGALVKLAINEGASLWLQRRLRALGVSLHAPAAEWLAHDAQQLLAQARRVDAQALDAIDLLLANGFQAVPLKAAAMWRLAQRVPYADARLAADVDLLLPEAAAQAAWERLLAAGYRAEPQTPTTHHLRVLVGPSGVAVEIHLSTMPSVPRAEAWRRATMDGVQVQLGAATLGVPSDTELLWNAVAHSVKTLLQIGAPAVRLVRWLDAAALLGADTSIDWDRIRARVDSPEVTRPDLVRIWFHTAAVLGGRPLPPNVLGEMSPAPAVNLVRLLAWRLRVTSRHPSPNRWREKLLVEGTRGEMRLPPEPAAEGASIYTGARHAAATRAARLWWKLRR